MFLRLSAELLRNLRVSLLVAGRATTLHHPNVPPYTKWAVPCLNNWAGKTLECRQLLESSGDVESNPGPIGKAKSAKRSV